MVRLDLSPRARRGRNERVFALIPAEGLLRESELVEKPLTPTLRQQAGRREQEEP